MVQIKEKTLSKIKEFCEVNNLDVEEYVNELIVKAFNLDRYGDRPFEIEEIKEEKKPINREVKKAPKVTAKKKTTIEKSEEVVKEKNEEIIIEKEGTKRRKLK